jgi:hypothetical protein
MDAARGQGNSREKAQRSHNHNTFCAAIRQHHPFPRRFGKGMRGRGIISTCCLFPIPLPLIPLPNIPLPSPCHTSWLWLRVAALGFLRLFAAISLSSILRTPLTLLPPVQNPVFSLAGFDGRRGFQPSQVYRGAPGKDMRSMSPTRLMGEPAIVMQLTASFAGHGRGFRRAPGRR